MDIRTMERIASRIGTAPDMALDERLPANIREHLRRARELGRAGPKAGFGPFRQALDGAICLANQSAVAGTSEAALFPVAQYAGWSANQLRAGQMWHLTAWGIMSTAGSSQGNITITPRYGTSSGGVALGASAATALVASASNVAWRLEYDFDVRTIGASGTNSTCAGNGWFGTTVAAIAASTGNVVFFGSTASVSVDASIAAGLYIGVTLGSASDSMTAMGVRLESVN